jgi:tetratricopeptide (TPR) repeat protein
MPFPSWSTREREHLFLLAILALALVVRFTHFLTIAGTAFPKFPLVFDQSDLNTYWEWAQAIRAGDWLGRATYHPAFDWMKAIAPQEVWYRWWGGEGIFQQAPLYAYGVAALLTVSRGSLEFVTVMQLVLGAFQPLVMFWLGRRLFDSRVGLVAAALTTVYGPFIFYQSVLLRDWLPPILEPLVLVALLRARARGRLVDWGLAGAALGLALVAKETLQLFVPLAFLWLALEHRDAKQRVATSCAAVFVGLLLVLSPLVARNALVGAPPFAFSNRAAEGLIEGNAADGFPIGLTDPPSMKGILERSDGRLEGVIREILGTYHGDWLKLARLELFKLRAVADPLEVPNNVDFYYGRQISPTLRLTLTYGTILPLGLTGFLLSLQIWRRHLLLILYALSTLTGLMSTIILARFRMVLVTILIVYAAVGLVWLFEAMRARWLTVPITYGSLLAGFALLVHLVLPIPSLREKPAFAIYPPDYLVAAHIYAHEGQFDRALAEIERLEARAAERPSFAELAREAWLYDGDYRTLWANQLLSHGRPDEAKRQAERVERQYASHPELSYPFYNLGFLNLKLGEPAKARAYFERFLAREPAGAQAENVRHALAEMKGPSSSDTGK